MSTAVSAASSRRRIPAVAVPVGVLAAVVALPALLGGDPLDQQLSLSLGSPGFGHLAGTDEYGRDVFLRVVHGARASVLVALAVVGISVAVGLLFGAGVALLPRLLRPAGTSVIDLVLGVPGIVVAIAIVGALGPGVRNVVVALAAVGWAWYARLTEEHTRDLLRSRFVDAALVAGVSPARVLATHVLPHVTRRLVVVACLDVGYAILAVAGLGFLGLGAQEPAPDLGLMLRSAQGYVLDAPWLLLAPAAAVLAVVVPFVAAGEEVHGGGLRV